MFIFFHGYSPDTWEEFKKAGLVRDCDGIRFCQSARIDESMKFNSLAKKGGELYRIIKDENRPLYIDRLQGGSSFQNYEYDKELVEEYKNILGDKFFGFQMHEWLSNYLAEVVRKNTKDIPDDEWTAENIEKVLREQYPNSKILYIESMSPKEMADLGKPKTFDEYYNNMTSIYKKRLETGPLVPCDSSILAYAFEIESGTKNIMPEIGAQTADIRMQICYARGMTRDDGRRFGVYYEPWGGEPFSNCTYNVKNEWNLESEIFLQGGDNGGSSRSLQKRIFLYAYLSNAEFISEEWGLYNTFLTGNDYELSPYGKVKKEFIDFIEKYDDVGEKLTPIAVVLPKDMKVVENIHNKDFWIFKRDHIAAFEKASDEILDIKKSICDIFSSPVEMAGDETLTFINSKIPDAIDMLNDGFGDLSKYEYLVNLTKEEGFEAEHKNCCETKDILEILKESLPCYVEGGLHWMVNKCTSGGYYLSVFNHSGVKRSIAEGEYTLPEEEKTVEITFKENALPQLCEGNGKLSLKDGKYLLSVPAGDWAFLKF